jgi:very-short-patch-repair endonuclease
MAATLAIRGSVASHGTAATLLGLPYGHTRVELTVVGSHSLLPGVRIHRAARMDRIDVALIRGIRTTSVSRTVIDLAGVLDDQRLEGLTSHVLAKRLVKLPYLLGRLEALGSHGRAGAGGLLALLRERQGCTRFVDSGAQRALGRLIDRYGLPRPQVEYAIQLPNGKWKFADAAWPGHRLILEVQGYEHHSDSDAWTADQGRNNQFVVLGWRVLFVTSTQIETDPGGVAALIAEALRLEAAAG